MPSPLIINVNDGDLEKAFKNLKKKMALEGIFKELKRRRYYEKPSKEKKRKREEAERRRLKKIRRMAAQNRTRKFSNQGNRNFQQRPQHGNQGSPANKESRTAGNNAASKETKNEATS